MKNKIYKTSILTLCILTATIVVQAQFPNFTKVDTGVVTQLWGGHASSTCFDMDNDGDLDLFVGNSAVGVNRIFSIFKNERNGFYVEMPEFITNLNYKMVSSFGDIDNDGDVDLVVGLPNYSLTIYNNNGYSNYQPLTSINSPDSKHYPTLLDLNNDGFLDVVGINIWGSVLYNNGNGGFLGWTDLGLFQEQPNVFLHGVSWGDADNDGDLDFFGGYSSLGSGIPTNLCYLNYGNGEFVQFDPTSPIVEGECTTTCANWVDYDNDGDMDLYVHNVICDNMLPALYENLGNMQFTRHDIIDEMYRYSFANSAVWGDLDNDGDLDLFITIENNEFPWPPPYTSATPFNVLYLNEGNGQFTNYLEEHPLVAEDSHTAMLFDYDNDGDLDVLMTRYSWSSDGYNNLFENEGNDNSWIVLTCEGTVSNRTAIGARVQAKCFVNGNHITQTREITPINGHLSYANLRVHFGFGDADVIDTLLIRWPSGIVDTYLDVVANQFYRAIEDEELQIEFKATNYIQYNPCIPNPLEIGETTLINLKDHYHFIEGDTVPEITGDTITFSVYSNENSNILQAEVFYGYILKLQPEALGESNIEILASSGFTERVDRFIVNVVDTVTIDITTLNKPEPLRIILSPNPFINEISIIYEIPQKSKISLEVYNYFGELVSILVDEIKQQGKHKIQLDGKELPVGIYFCVLKTNEGVLTKKMIKL